MSEIALLLYSTVHLLFLLCIIVLLLALRKENVGGNSPENAPKNPIPPKGGTGVKHYGRCIARDAPTTPRPDFPPSGQAPKGKDECDAKTDT